MTLHELSHIAVAGALGLRAERIIFSALGETAVIKNLDTAGSLKRYLIISAGPISNFILAIVSGLLTQLLQPGSVISSSFSSTIATFATANIFIGTFNLLPVYPLDGGRLLQTFLANAAGTLTANSAIKKISRALSTVIMATGVLQFVLYPYNISLFCIGFFLSKTAEREYIGMTADFWKQKTNIKPNLLPVKCFAVQSQTPLKYIINRLCTDSYHIYYIPEQNSSGNLFLTEDDIIEYMLSHGSDGSINSVMTHYFCTKF